MLTMGDQWEQVAGPLLHPDDTHLIGRSKILHGGHLVRHRQTGVYRLSTGGASLRSVPQDWARQAHAEQQPAPMTPEALRALRERIGSQDHVARLLGCPQATLSRLETGVHEPKRWHLLALLYLIEHEGRTPWDG